MSLFLRGFDDPRCLLKCGQGARRRNADHEAIDERRRALTPTEQAHRAARRKVVICM